MIDIHSHILNGVDDGAKSLERSLEMLAKAKENGITTLFATPHYSKMLPAVIDDKYDELKVEAEKLGIALIKGCEIDYVHLEETRPLITMGDTNFILIDMRQPFLEMSCENVISQLQMDGYRTIIAHPERLFVEKDLHTVRELAEMDCLFQLNASSIVGNHGTPSQRVAFKIIEEGFAHYMGSDAHGLRRGFYMKEASEIIKKKYGAEVTELLTNENAKQLLLNQDPYRVIYKKKKWFQFFK